MFCGVRNERCNSWVVFDVCGGLQSFQLCSYISAGRAPNVLYLCFIRRFCLTGSLSVRWAFTIIVIK